MSQDIANDGRERLLALFAYEHLPLHLQAVSKPFHDLAHELVKVVPQNAERTIALRNLWDAKNYAVAASGIAAGIAAPRQEEAKVISSLSELYIEGVRYPAGTYRIQRVGPAESKPEF